MGKKQLNKTLLEETQHSIANIDSSLLVQMHGNKKMGVQAARNLNVGKMAEDLAYKQGGEIVHVKAEKKNNGVLLTAEKTKLVDGKETKDSLELDVMDIIDNFKGTVRLPRTPRVLAIKRNTEPEIVDKIISKTYDTLNQNNEKFGRADTLYILRVPLEEYQRMAIKSEVEKEVKKRMDDEITIKNVEYINESGKLIAEPNKEFKLKRRDLIPKAIADLKRDPSLINDPNSDAYKILNVGEIVVKDPTFSLRQTRNELKKLLDVKKISREDYRKFLHSKGQGKLRITNVLMEVLGAYPDTPIEEREIKVYGEKEKEKGVKIKVNAIKGLDLNSLGVTGKYKIDNDEFSLSRPITFFETERKPEVIGDSITKDDVEKLITYKRRRGKEFEKNTQILQIISQFQPNTHSVFYPKGKVDGVNLENPSYTNKNEYIGSKTGRVGIPSIAFPEMPKAIENIILEKVGDPKLGIKDSKELKDVYDWMEAQDEAQVAQMVNETHRCPVGSIDIHRMATQSKALTPPQKRCDINLIEERMKLSAEQLLNDPTHSKIVGCNSQDELNLIMENQKIAVGVKDFISTGVLPSDVSLKDNVEKITKKFGIFDKVVELANKFQDARSKKDRQLENEIKNEREKLKAKNIKKIEKDVEYRVPMRFSVRTSEGSGDYFCKEITNTLPNINVKVDASNGKITRDENGEKIIEIKDDAIDVKYTVKKKKKPVFFIKTK